MSEFISYYLLIEVVHQLPMVILIEYWYEVSVKNYRKQTHYY